MAYSELIKKFEKIRSYMREFYIYGFKSREDYENIKSLRSYDDERRRVESWLGEYTNFARTAEGKSMFISIDSRAIKHNPFYNVFKSKSFTDGDITLHFILFDILSSSGIKMSLNEIIDIADRRYLNRFQTPMIFDESTVRKKLNEYIQEGLVVSEKRGKKIIYRRAEDIDISRLIDATDFFSEVMPCGVVGSYICDMQPKHEEVFTFKHHYLNVAIESEIVGELFSAMRKKSSVTILNVKFGVKKARKQRVIPLKILFSVQNGRQYLVAYYPETNKFLSVRLDYISSVKSEEYTPRFDELRKTLSEIEKHLWGVSFKSYGPNKKIGRVEFSIKVEKGEEYIIRRLYREKRIGTVEKTDERTYKFFAEVYDPQELVPWIRTFICRIVSIDFSDKRVEEEFKKDIEEMYKIYDIRRDSE